MNTKVSVALLSGLSLFLSAGAFAVSDNSDGDYVNWSYVMAASAPESTPSVASAANNLSMTEGVSSDITCTEGCPARPEDCSDTFDLIFEDETDPAIGAVLSASTPDSRSPQSERLSDFRVGDNNRIRIDIDPALAGTDIFGANDTFRPTVQTLPPVIETRYIDTPQVQYPVTRQYPVSVEYPVTVQRNMTIEQPVIMQQPIVVRRPVVMQQDITVQRQPTLIQNQPMLMQQQPTYVQQQPMVVQAPAEPVNPAMFGGFGMPFGMPYPVQYPQQQMMSAPYPMPTQPVQPVYMPQQAYPAQQPFFAGPMMQPAPVQPMMPQPAVSGQPVSQQPPVMQPVLSTPVY